MNEDESIRDQIRFNGFATGQQCVLQFDGSTGIAARFLNRRQRQAGRRVIAEGDFEGLHEANRIGFSFENAMAGPPEVMRLGFLQFFDGTFGFNHVSHTYWPATKPEAQAHWKLKPPSCPVTSTTSPTK